MTKKIGIIGSGIAGLASAVRMAARNYEVHVFEANNYPGGKLTENNLNKYRFDAGPSLFTMPEYFEELFALAGRSFYDSCPYQRLDVITHYFYMDGTRFKSYSSVENSAQEMENELKVDKKAVIEHIENSKKIFNLTSKTFLQKSIHHYKNFSLFDLLKITTHLKTLNLFNTMHAVNVKKLNNQKAIQYFDRFATYNGSNPYEAPAVLNVIPHLEHNIGAYFPKGGMISLTESCYKLAIDLGVKFHFNKKVNEIIVQNKKVSGLAYNEVKQINNQHIDVGDTNFIPLDTVISNMDIAYTYKKLLPKQTSPKKILNQPRALSALVFYFGIKKEFKELGLHNIFFSENYKEEFDTYFKKNTLYSDPTVYINISSKFKQNDAPQGCENWFVMINTPPQIGQDWDKLIKDARTHILQKLSTILNTDIESLIEEEDVLEPRIIESKTFSYQGSLYGNSSNNKFSAFLRHANFSSRIKGLYFCGGSVHPGGGIPLSLLSAKIIDDIIH
ncbi:MAG: phytoene desaturase family protein [Chitinophagales bacterium]|nr:phytoene desaturase family protein [Chitinophagales bacterium]